LARACELPNVVSEVAGGVTCNGFGDCVSLLREPDAANPHVRFDERGVGAAMLDDVPVVESTTGGVAQIPP
jgi:hypothetical protein